MKARVIASPSPGDYGLVRGTGPAMWAVRWGTHSRFGHVRLCVDVDGPAITVVEAKPAGALRRTLGKLEGAETTWVSVDPTPAQRAGIVTQGEALVGIGYGWTDIAALALWCLCGWRWRWLDTRINRQDRLICSQLVALAYARAGLVLMPDRLPCEITPGDLAHLTQA